MTRAEKGQLERHDGGFRLRFERRLPHPPERVWRALTEPRHLSAWFPTAIEGERRAGASLRFVFPGDRGPTLEGEMLAYEPCTLLEFRWNEDLLRFELEPDGDGTVVTFVNTFDELGRAARDASGWHLCLDALAWHMENEATPFDFGTPWPDVHAAYIERLGPEAATIGPSEGAAPPE
ncbi:MAG TPA: SRPBCC family protein [Candidatus Dormibacteraeota bacterium]|jgi:uncharacterized protein YndB with AHSA1/START domain|nr:SRPBCC family protein [Candidatus Dormibacteraeota bacterium]